MSSVFEGRRGMGQHTFLSGLPTGLSSSTLEARFIALSDFGSIYRIWVTMGKKRVFPANEEERRGKKTVFPSMQKERK